jgi:hypothetical protein
MSKTPTKPGVYYAKIDGVETVLLVDERMQYRNFTGAMFGEDNPALEWLGEAVPTLGELRKLRAKQGPEGWTPVTFEKGDMVIDQLKDGTWIVEKPAQFVGLTESGEWKQSYRAQFKTLHEAAQAAEKGKK